MAISERLNLYLDVLREKPTITADEADQRVAEALASERARQIRRRRQDGESANLVGLESEQRAARLFYAFEEVYSVEAADRSENAHGIDLWVHCVVLEDDGRTLMAHGVRVPVQVKSSFRGVSRAEAIFIQKRKHRFTLNAGDEREDDREILAEIQNRFSLEWQIPLTIRKDIEPIV